VYCWLTGEVTEYPDGIVFTYSGTGKVTTPPFDVESSPWKLSYTADWDGHFAVTVSGNLVVNQSVSANHTYETYVYDTTGSLHFSIVSAPSDGTWTLLVEEVQQPSVVPGDANGDGVINVLDLAWTARMIAGLEANGDTYPGADANQDGSVNVLDLAKIARIIAGLD